MKEPMVIRCLLVALVLAFTVPAAFAQTPTPTPAQLGMLRQLPPDQQAQVLQQFRSQSGQPRLDRPLEMPESERQANVNATPGSDDDIILEDNEVLIVPRPMQAVTVVGEVQGSTSILERPCKWFRSSDLELQPGDTIVVLTDIERMRPLPLWSAVTQDIFNLAVAVAAVNSF